MSRRPFTEHYKFHTASRLASDALIDAADKLGLKIERHDTSLDDFEVQAGRVVDDMTKLLLRAWDRSQSKRSA